MLHEKQSVSRDFSYLSFQHSNQPYQRKDIVGGEHMSYVYVLGFAGQAYRIDLDATDGDASASIYGEGVRVESINSAKTKHGVQQVMVYVEAEHTWVEIALSAVTVGNYQLTISKPIQQGKAHDNGN